MTVLFGNGRTEIGADHAAQLLALAQKAMGIKGYMVQVKGLHPRSVAELNQRLSLERARNVTNFLEQQGNIPLTNIRHPAPWARCGSGSRHNLGGTKPRIAELW